MKQYLRDQLPANVPQSEPLRSDQVENSAGGHVWAVGPLERLRRFLILGTEGGSYYAAERKLTSENVLAVATAVRELGVGAVAEILAISKGGRAPKNDPAIFALAIAASEGDAETRNEALRSIPGVCRTGTHLFQFVEALDAIRGWGRAPRRAVAAWYENKTPADLGYQLVKYRQRGGWTHRDVLRLAHPRATTPTHRALYSLATTGQADAGPRIVEGYVRAQQATPADAAKLVREYGLTREMLPSEALASPVVWEALLETEGALPITAMIRNLGNMTRLGVLSPTATATRRILERLADEDELRRGRVHPLQVLTALKTYAQGHGIRGGGEWRPVGIVIDALDEAFYRSFGAVETTGKRYLVAVDVSGSMSGGQVAGAPLSPREAAAALALTTVNTELLVEVMAFSAGFVPLDITRRTRLDDAVRRTSRMPFDSTDCAVPMLYAIAQKREVDVFVVLTDSETWYGQVHPAQALAQYRRESGIDARLAVVGMVANGFSIADPADPRMLDVVGFDTATPQILAAFARGDF